MRFLAASLDHDALLAFRRLVFMQRQFNVLALVLPVTSHGGEIALVGGALAHLVMQIGQCAALLADQ